MLRRSEPGKSQLCKTHGQIVRLELSFHISEVENFVWQTSDGEHRRPTDMANSHLLLAVKQIWNESCQPSLAFRDIVPMRLKHWSERYTRAAVVALCLELAKRVDSLTPEQIADLVRMRELACSTWKSVRHLLLK